MKTIKARKGSAYDPCVECPCHNGEWRTCQAQDDLTCPEAVEHDDGMSTWRIPDACPLPITVVLDDTKGGGDADVVE